MFRKVFAAARTLGVSAVALALGAVSLPAGASSLSAQWYTINWGHADTERSIDGLTPGLVLSTLGPDGLPVRSPLSAGSPSTSSNLIRDVDGGGQILWWTPGTRAGIGTVSVDPFYPSTVSLPINQPSNLFPGGLGSNGNPNGYVAARFSGLFDTPVGGSVTLNLGADDDAWVFVNGVLRVDNGGVKALQSVPTVISGLLPGTNRIDLFFADRHVVQSGLRFSADVNFRPVPEPATLGLLGAGLVGLAAIRRRRRAG